MGAIEANSRIRQKLEAFSDDMQQAFNVAYLEIVADVRKDVEATYLNRLYNNSCLTRFSQMEVCQDNAVTFNNIFKMLGECDNIHPADTEAIRALGLKYGYNEEESLCIYNMRRFEITIDHMRSQRTKTLDILTGGV